MRAEHVIPVIVALVMVAGLVMFIVKMNPSSQTQPSTITIGNEYSNYQLESIDGEIFTLSEYTGNIIVIEFMRTDCPHCNEFLPTFKEFCRRYRDKGVVFITVSLEPIDRLSSYAKMKGMDWIVARDMTGGLAVALGVKYVPTVVIIDRDGSVYKTLIGTQSLKDLENALLPLLQE